jgi:hypothetical protein
VTSIGDNIFAGCSGLNTLSVEVGNTKYDSRDNCNAIIETETNTLISGTKNTIIPNSVTSISFFAFSGCSGLTSLTIPNSVTSIGFGAFEACSGLTSLTIPSSVILIGNSTFMNCSSLTSLNVEAGNTKYDSRDNCNAIIETETNTLISGTKNSIIPNSVSSIGEYAFQSSSGLTSVSIPNSVTSIDESAFMNCYDLTSVIIPNSVTSIGNLAFASCSRLESIVIDVKIPITISERVFTNKANATLYVPAGSKAAYQVADYWKEFKVIIEGNKVTKNVETAGTLSQLISSDEKFTITDLTITGQLNGTDLRLIREMAGNDYLGQPTNGSLKKLDLSGANIVAGDKKYLDTDQIISSTQESMPNIGDNSFHFATQENVLGTALFAGCDKLEEIVLPNSIEAIGDYVFWNCLNLKALEIPKNVSSIGWRFINGQNDISKLSVAEGNQTFSSPDGSNALMKGTELVFGLSSTKIPAGTTIIGSEAFYNCTGLGDMTLPEGVTTIKGGAFAWSDLTSIKMPSTLTTIENDAFADCSGLTSFTLPKSVTHYGEGLGALKECGNLASIKVEDGNTKYDSRDNCNAIIETATKTLVSGCKNTVIPNTVTIIGLQAFRGSSLTSIVIPSSVTMIGELAFLYCNNLTSVSVDVTTPLAITENTFTNRANATLYVPAGSKAAYEAADYWKDFKEIIEMEDPSVRTVNVTTAGTLSQSITSDDMFSITELTITGPLNGTDLRLIREMAGSDIKGVPTDGKLQKLDLSGATIVAGGTYLNLEGQCIYLDKEKTQALYGFIAGAKTSVANTFGDYLFAGCQKLQSIKTPSTLTTIGERVFAESGLTSIELNSGLTAINYCAFWYTKLSSITIPNTVTAIGTNGWIENPFAYNDNLTSITLEAGNSRYSMSAGGKLLIDNTNHAVICALGNEAIPEGITIIGSNAFSNRPELVNYTIPEGVTLTNPSYPNIGNNTFSQCVNLKTITIPEGITVISNAAFVDCTSLNNVTIPSTVTRIGYNTFGNTGLEEITIPASVTYIDNQAFAHNQNLETVISYITNPFDINDDVFAKGWDLSTTTYPKTLKVPAGTKALYEAKTGWKKIANIVEMTQTPAITVTAKNYSRVYGEANPTFESEVTGGTVTGTPEITCTATATSGVGTYPIVIAAGTITDASVQYVNGTLTVTKAPLKISVGNYTKKQGEENPTFSLTYDGFKNNETSAVFTTQPTITCAATKDSPAGSYDITVSGAVAGNYEITYVAGKLTIEAAPEPKGTTFEEDVDDLASSEVNAKFTVTESSGSDTPTVSISSDDDGVSGQLEIPETVTHNGVEYKVTEISDGAFQNNTSLTGVTIPASIVSIKENAFAGCTNLKSITIYVVVPINLATAAARAYVRGITRSTGSSVFEGVDKNTCILYVPEGSVEAYKAAPVWKDFKNILPMGGTTGIYGVELTDGETFDVYNLSGLKVKSQTTSLDGLPKGIYIVKGKKVVK